MADRNYFGDKPDLAIFADTGWEPRAVYDNVEWLQGELSFPVVTVSNGRSLRDDVLAGVNTSGKPWVTIPVYLAGPDGSPAGINWRQCTTNYKVAPILRACRAELGLTPRSSVPDMVAVEMWLGISVDEMTRMRVATEPWIDNRYPLVDGGLSRADCIAWFHAEYPGQALPRSACVGCPYRSAESWAAVRDSEPEAFKDAVKIDEALRSPGHNAERMFRGQAFLHGSRKPLADMVTAPGQSRESQDHWGNECTGMCGV